MAELRTKNIFLDTQVFDSFNLSFDSKVLQELVNLVKAGYANVFTTKITKSGVETRPGLTDRRDMQKLRSRQILTQSYHCTLILRTMKSSKYNAASEEIFT